LCHYTKQFKDNQDEQFIDGLNEQKQFIAEMKKMRAASK
jgi:hypothetical protein